MHIYAFGSICRGEVSPDSDVDLLAIVESYDARFDPNVFSIYTYRRMRELWVEGNPFAWHLSLESRLLFSSDGSDFLEALGSPEPYRYCVRDCEKFLMLFRDAYDSIMKRKPSIVFDLSTIFLSIRNFASCFSLGMTDRPNFSRHSALSLGDRSLQFPRDSYRVLEKARILCTRGQGTRLIDDEIGATVQQLHEVAPWMMKLLGEVKEHERIQ